MTKFDSIEKFEPSEVGVYNSVYFEGHLFLFKKAEDIEVMICSEEGIIKLDKTVDSWDDIDEELLTELLNEAVIEEI